MLGSVLLNLPLPGAGHVLRGRVALGLGLLLPSLLIGSGLLLVGLIGSSGWAGSVRGGLLGAYLALALAAVAIQLAIDWPRHLDPELVRRLHREAAVAFLGDRPSEAIAPAEQLSAHAPREPGAWRLLALVAEAAGDRDRERRARRRLARLLAEHEGQP